jgi:hypothetical protein
MGLFRHLVHRNDTAGVKPIEGGLEISATLSEGMFRVDAVGESHYQEALESIAGGRTEDGANLETVALLVPEPDNRYDRNAVAVWIDGKQVGYLSRGNAEILQPAILTAIGTTRRQVACKARVVGGWDRGGRDRGHFGVRLFIEPADFNLDAGDLDGRWEEPDRETARFRSTGRRDGAERSTAGTTQCRRRPCAAPLRARRRG